MIGRISLAAGLLALFTPVLAAQTTTGWRPTLRAPRLIPDGASLSQSRTSHDPMPVAKPDSTRRYSILVAPPQCTPDPAR